MESHPFSFQWNGCLHLIVVGHVLRKRVCQKRDKCDKQYGGIFHAAKINKNRQNSRKFRIKVVFLQTNFLTWIKY